MTPSEAIEEAKAALAPFADNANDMHPSWPDGYGMHFIGRCKITVGDLRRASRALAALSGAGVAEGWRTIESAPRDGTPVLVWSVPVASYYNADEPPHVAIAYWLERRPNEIRMGFHSGWVWHGMAGCTFTHWQPLPTPPANQETGT